MVVENWPPICSVFRLSQLQPVSICCDKNRKKATQYVWKAGHIEATENAKSVEKKCQNVSQFCQVTIFYLNHLVSYIIWSIRKLNCYELPKIDITSDRWLTHAANRRQVMIVQWLNLSGLESSYQTVAIGLPLKPQTKPAPRKSEANNPYRKSFCALNFNFVKYRS